MLKIDFLGFFLAFLGPSGPIQAHFWRFSGAQIFRLNYPYFNWIFEYGIMIYVKIESEKGLKLSLMVFSKPSECLSRLI